MVELLNEMRESFKSSAPVKEPRSRVDLIYVTQSRGF